jgi:DNA-binding GntR family transcriptional regulator
LQELLESRAYRIIKNDIVNAILSPGILLSENEISATLGISRTPVHSAIVRLEKEGFIESQPKRGFLVKDISFTDFIEMHETIISMEYYALSRITEENPVDLAELKRNLDQQVTALEYGDNVAYYEAGFHFATAVLAVTGNKAMVDVVVQFRDKMLCKVLNFRKDYPDHKPKLLRNRNEKIYEALSVGNVSRAQRELLHTMINVRDFLYGWG